VTLAGLGTALGLPVIPVPDLRHQASRLAGRFLGEPSAHLQVMGVTGTHGKTCITHYLAQALASDLSCGLINPLGVGFPDDLEPARPTPLDPVSLQETLARLRARGARAVALAVSTQALAQGRTRGLHFSHAIFTQVRRDHLDCIRVHLAGRGPARRGLRQVPGPAWAILNLDAPLSPRLLKALAGEVQIGGYSLEAARAIPRACTLWARLRDLEPTPGGMRLALETSAGAANLEVGLIGRRTAAAVLAVLLVLLSRGLDLERALRTLAQVRGVPGRLEPFGGHRAPWVVVDAAHTPQALTRVLLDLRTHARGRLICVFGCAGDRDAGHRPQMGAVAERLADQVLLTDDNPRREAGRSHHRPDPERHAAAGAGGHRAPAGPGHSAAPLPPPAGMTWCWWRAGAMPPARIAGTTRSISVTAPKSSRPSPSGGGGSLPGGRGMMASALPWTLGQAVARVGGRLLGADGDFRGIGIDSRQDLSGRLFVALTGERQDGHDFAASARDQGAAALMVQRPLAIDLPQWQVADTRLALGQLAAAHRDRFAGRVVALTGSNGKTTTKEMLAAILGQAGRVRATRGNLNNDLGLPLTLLEAGDEEYLILEMGANHPGEIAYLTAIARPEVAAITNAGRAHLEGFGSLEGVARAKGEIAQGLRQDGTFVFPADAPWTGLWRELAGTRTCLACGPVGAADLSVDLTAVRTRWDEEGFRTCFRVTAPGLELDLELELALAGAHNVRNALVAVAMAQALGIAPEAIQAGLAAMQPVAGRLFPCQIPGGPRLIDDSYNANPDSVEAAIAVLMALPGRHVLVLGDLGELGPEAPALHHRLGRAAQEAGVDVLYTVGLLSAEAAAGFGRGARHFNDQAELIAALRQTLAAGDLVLVKGSRRAAMDRVVAALRAPEEG
jgi:UDP-N-acetylmuramoyl-tripeptide--D-alanyl-D-alanine ligase/UDP-N-acetylmuramyl-tripeptide synthetase